MLQLLAELRVRRMVLERPRPSLGRPCRFPGGGYFPRGARSFRLALVLQFLRQCATVVSLLEPVSGGGACPWRGGRAGSDAPRGSGGVPNGGIFGEERGKVVPRGSGGVQHHSHVVGGVATVAPHHRRGICVGGGKEKTVMTSRPCLSVRGRGGRGEGMGRHCQAGPRCAAGLRCAGKEGRGDGLLLLCCAAGERGGEGWPNCFSLFHFLFYFSQFIIYVFKCNSSSNLNVDA